MSLRSNIIKSGLKEIPGFPGYFVSKYGDVYSTRREGRPSKTEGNANGQLHRKTLHKSGRYIGVRLHIDGKSYSYRVHTLVLTTFARPRKSGQCARHLDGNGVNNYLSNLCWGSYSENEIDKRAHGRAPIGSKHGRAKLNDKKVREIRRLYSKGWLQKDLAVKFGVSRHHIGEIVNRKCWTHI